MRKMKCENCGHPIVNLKWYSKRLEAEWMHAVGRVENHNSIHCFVDNCYCSSPVPVKGGIK